MAAVRVEMKDAILAVLREAKERGIGALTRTALIKFVYLLDCMHAEAHEGKTASGTKWLFHHFGPYAQALSAGVEEMARVGVVQSRAGETQDKEFAVYWLGEFPVGPSLADVGLNSGASTRFSRLMRDLGNDLPKLLDHVYFRTLPMQDATPGQPLGFDGLAGQGSTVHRHTHIQDHSKIFRLAELAHKLSQKAVEGGNARALAAHRPIYDDIYTDALSELDGYREEDDGVAAIRFRAALS